MTLLRRLSILFLLGTIPVLECNRISIRGSDAITYDPRNPSTNRLTCQDDNNVAIRDATWTREYGSDDTIVVESGRLILNENIIGSDNPQDFEDMYRCHHNGDMSAPIAFYGKAVVFYYVIGPP